MADLISQGLLRIPATDSEWMFRIPGLQASDFILTYELSPQPAFNSLSLFFRAAEGEFGYQFAMDDLWGHYRMSKELPNLELRLSDGSLGRLVPDQFYSVTIFAYGQTVAIIFDGELVYYSENTAYQDEYINFLMNYGERAGNLQEDSLHFDSIRFWNLDGVAVDFESENE